MQQVTLDHLHATAYQGTPLSRTVLGPTDNIKFVSHASSNTIFIFISCLNLNTYVRSISKNDLLKYVGTHYKAPRMVLAAAGGVNHDQLVRLSEEHFGGLKASYQDEVPDLLPCR